MSNRLALTPTYCQLGQKIIDMSSNLKEERTDGTELPATMDSQLKVKSCHVPGALPGTRTCPVSTKYFPMRQMARLFCKLYCHTHEHNNTPTSELTAVLPSQLPDLPLRSCLWTCYLSATAAHKKTTGVIWLFHNYYDTYWRLTVVPLAVSRLSRDLGKFSKEKWAAMAYGAHEALLCNWHFYRITIIGRRRRIGRP
jgi:hypothetical protein